MRRLTQQLTIQSHMILPAVLAASVLISCEPNIGTSVEMNNKGTEYYFKGELDAAIDMYDKAIAINPLMPEPYSNLCLAYTHKYAYQIAIEKCDKAISLKPDYAIAFNNRAGAYLGLGDNVSAEQDLKVAIRLDTDLISAYTTRSALYNATGRYELAIDDTTYVIRKQPDNHVAFNNRAYARYCLDDLDTAQRDIEEAIRLQPNYPQAHYIFGLIKQQRGDTSQAAEYYRKTLELSDDPDLRERAENGLEAVEGIQKFAPDSVTPHTNPEEVAP